MAEDKVNEPSHYKGLATDKGYTLMVRHEGVDGEGTPAQVIDVIENVCYGLPGGLATNLGNVIKYSLRCGKKAADASYQSSQKEKNIEECGKIVWYANRFGSCLGDEIQLKLFASIGATLPNLYLKVAPCSFISTTYVDICECVKTNFSEKAYACLLSLWLNITEIVTAGTPANLESASRKLVCSAEDLLNAMKED